jgi:hypothetical protein
MTKSLSEVQGASEEKCEHRALQFCKEQNVLACGTMYVCGKCSTQFMVNPIEAPTPQPKEPMFPKNSVPWGLRGRQA